MGYLKTGVFSKRELKSIPCIPSAKRMRKGPVAIIECAQEIPCDPCENSCPFGAIKVGKPITNLPLLIEDRCNGCGICIAPCPGLAIFVIDEIYSKDEALLSLPYELLPVPEIGSEVIALDRMGRERTKAKVMKVLNPKKFDNTCVVTIKIPKKLSMEIRAIKVVKK